MLIGEQGPIAKSIFDIPLAKVKNVSLLGEFCEEYLLHPNSTVCGAVSRQIVEVGVLHKKIVLNE